MQLDGHEAAGHERHGRKLEQAAIDVEAVGATCKRERRLELGNLVGKDAHHVVGYIGRVRDEHGEGAHELGRHAGGKVALDDVDGIGKTQGVAVLAREGR